MAETEIDELAPDAAPPEEGELDEENRLKGEFVRAVADALAAGDEGRVYELVEPLHPADIADLFELLDHDERAGLAKAITDLLTADVIAELNDYVREDMMEALPPEAVADIAEQLDTDDAVQLIEDLEPEDQRAILAEMEPEDRAAIESALAYPEETAGRLMQREFVAVPEHMTVGDLIDYMREHDELPTEFWEVFVVDALHKPVGTCALSWILRTPRGVALSDVMKRDQTLIPVGMDQEEVALRFQKYALISAAVVDESGRLVGQLTVDDIVHIISEEAGEDVMLLSGAAVLGVCVGCELYGFAVRRGWWREDDAIEICASGACEIDRAPAPPDALLDQRGCSSARASRGARRRDTPGSEQAAPLPGGGTFDLT